MAASPAFLEPLNRLLESRGFKRESGFAKIRWSGQLDGRSCIVSISAQGRTRYSGDVRRREHLGYRVRIEMSTSVQVRLFFVPSAFARNRLTRWIYRLRRQEVIAEVPSALQGFDVVATDRNYALRLIHQPSIPAMVGDLLKRFASPLLAGSVHFGPGTIYFASPVLQPESITPEYVADTSENLKSTLAIAEQLPAPQTPCAPTRLEELSKDNPMLVAILFLFGGLSILLIGAVLLISLFVLLR